MEEAKTTLPTPSLTAASNTLKVLRTFTYIRRSGLTPIPAPGTAAIWAIASYPRHASLIWVKSVMSPLDIRHSVNHGGGASKVGQVVAGGEQFPQHVAADLAGAARDEDLHRHLHPQLRDLTTTIGVQPEGSAKTVALITLSRIKGMSTVPQNAENTQLYLRTYGRSPGFVRDTLTDAFQASVIEDATVKDAFTLAKEKIDAELAKTM